MSSNPSIPIFFVNAEQIQQDHADHQAWLDAFDFKGKPGTHCFVPGANGILAKVLVGRPKTFDTWTLGNLATSLPPHTYHLADDISDEVKTQLSLGWSLGQYRFQQYKQQQKPEKPLPQLSLPQGTDAAYVEAATAATFLVRDLITTPANDMGPAQLETQAQQLADSHQATLRVVCGEDLLEQNYPMIYAVGKASDQAPRLLDLRWGNPDTPKVTLVGKGVCFDSGGLDIKSAGGMKRMKKDMGGAAHVLGLAQLIMTLQLPVCLRVLVPAVENSIAGNAMRPLDILSSRKGATVEVGNTDAEGRLVLADALWDASTEFRPEKKGRKEAQAKGDNSPPQLLIDYATLTGAARVALGTELPAFFCTDVSLAQTLKQAGQAVDDPLWELPLHKPYRSLLDSPIADLSNISSGSYGGAITAALFLKEFVKPGIPWIHIDVMAWNIRNLPGRPEGGEAMGLRAMFELIRRWLADA